MPAHRHVRGRGKIDYFDGFRCLFSDRWQQAADLLSDIRLDEQSRVFVAIPEDELIVHVPDMYSRDRNASLLEHQRLKAHIEQMLILDRSGGFTSTSSNALSFARRMSTITASGPSRNAP